MSSNRNALYKDLSVLFRTLYRDNHPIIKASTTQIASQFDGAFQGISELIDCIAVIGKCFNSSGPQDEAEVRRHKLANCWYTYLSIGWRQRYFPGLKIVSPTEHVELQPDAASQSYRTLVTNTVTWLRVWFKNYAFPKGVGNDNEGLREAMVEFEEAFKLSEKLKVDCMHKFRAKIGTDGKERTVGGGIMAALILRKVHHPYVTSTAGAFIQDFVSEAKTIIGWNDQGTGDMTFIRKLNANESLIDPVFHSLLWLNVLTNGNVNTAKGIFMSFLGMESKSSEHNIKLMKSLFDNIPKTGNRDLFMKEFFLKKMELHTPMVFSSYSRLFDILCMAAGGKTESLVLLDVAPRVDNVGKFLDAYQRHGYYQSDDTAQAKTKGEAKEIPPFSSVVTKMMCLGTPTGTSKLVMGNPLYALMKDSEGATRQEVIDSMKGNMWAEGLGPFWKKCEPFVDFCKVNKGANMPLNASQLLTILKAGTNLSPEELSALNVEDTTDGGPKPGTEDESEAQFTMFEEMLDLKFKNIVSGWANFSFEQKVSHAAKVQEEEERAYMIEMEEEQRRQREQSEDEEMKRMQEEELRRQEEERLRLDAEARAQAEREAAEKARLERLAREAAERAAPPPPPPDPHPWALMPEQFLSEEEAAATTKASLGLSDSINWRKGGLIKDRLEELEAELSTIAPSLLANKELPDIKPSKYPGYFSTMFKNCKGPPYVLAFFVLRAMQQKIVFHEMVNMFPELSSYAVSFKSKDVFLEIQWAKHIMSHMSLGWHFFFNQSVVPKTSNLLVLPKQKGSAFYTGTVMATSFVATVAIDVQSRGQHPFQQYQIRQLYPDGHDHLARDQDRVNLKLLTSGFTNMFRTYTLNGKTWLIPQIKETISSAPSRFDEYWGNVRFYIKELPRKITFQFDSKQVTKNKEEIALWFNNMSLSLMETVENHFGDEVFLRAKAANMDPAKAEFFACRVACFYASSIIRAAGIEASKIVLAIFRKGTVTREMVNRFVAACSRHTYAQDKFLSCYIGAAGTTNDKTPIDTRSCTVKYIRFFESGPDITLDVQAYRAKVDVLHVT